LGTTVGASQLQVLQIIGNTRHGEYVVVEANAQRGIRSERLFPLSGAAAAKQPAVRSISAARLLRPQR
jgi:hypothetical protein